jgi:hypothetical protein
MDASRFWEYKLTAEMLCLGERIKKATFRPTLLTIPSTQATGAIRAATRHDNLWAIGYLDEIERHRRDIERVVFAPRDKGTDISKLPLAVEILRDVQAHLFVRAQAEAPPFQHLDITLGAFRMKGVGQAKLDYTREVKLETRTGVLKSRLPESEKEQLGITAVQKPLYGYLFKPNPPTGDEYSLSGKYVRALLEKSLVTGYTFMLDVIKE